MASEKRIDYVILGLLSHEPMTGYEIKKRIDTTLRFFWGASYGSIYPTLNTLEKKGFVSKNCFTENGREKITYTIAEPGRDYLKEWLEVPVIKDELRYETLLKLFFGNEIGALSTLKHIENFEGKVSQDLPFLEGSVRSLKQVQDLDETHTYYMLTAMFGEKIYHAYLEWCKDAKEILNRRDKK
ncbi:MAG TPA: PadR family transcriptional regulator [Lachnospiraceae bacterium]|nr:PadR family transcriptional regulator [Lachnospiraceae bacterium]